MRTPAAVRMSPLLLIMLLVLAVQCFAQPSSSFGEDALPEDDATYADDGADEEPEESLFDSNPHWREFAGRLQRSVDAAGLIRARRWGNIANGALLAATGPVALTVSLFGLRLSNVVLSLYVAAFGGLLAGIELNATPITPWNFNALLDFVSIDDGELHGTAPSPSRSRVQAAPESGDVTEELARIAQQARQARDAQQAANAAQAEAEAEAQAQAAAAQETAKAARMQAMEEALANARATSGQNEEPVDDPQ
eukprot:jgi/Chrpa1/13379/Chrysochromulina_OHIO_Genome00004746-RA